MGWVCAALAAGMLAGLTGCSEGLPDEGAESPVVAGESSTIGVPRGCSPTGEPRVLATSVAPGAPILATAVAPGDSTVLLGFQTTKAPLAITSVNVRSLEAVTGAPGAVAPLEGRKLVPAHEVQDGKLVAWTSAAGPGQTRTSGGATRSWHVRPGVADVGALDPDDVGFEGAVIGKPALAVGNDGRGVLAFVESNGEGFQLVATRVVCATP
jgi:hypothetical protein